MINWSDEGGLLGGFREGWKSGVADAFSPERQLANQRRQAAVKGAQEQVRAARINAGLQALGRGADQASNRAAAAGFETVDRGGWGAGGYRPAQFRQKALPGTNYATQAQAIGQGEQEAANAKSQMYKDLSQISADEADARSRRMAAERAEQTRQAERMQNREWQLQDLQDKQTYQTATNAIQQSHELLKIDRTWDRRDSQQATALVNQLTLMREQGGIKGTLLEQQINGQIRAIQERGSVSKLLQEGANAHDIELINHEFNSWVDREGIKSGYADAASARDFNEQTALNAQNIAGRMKIAANNQAADFDQLKYTMAAKAEFLDTKVDYWKWRQNEQNVAALAQIDAQGLIDMSMQDETLDAREQAQLRRFQHENLRDDVKYSALNDMLDKRLNASSQRLTAMQSHDERMQERDFQETMKVWELDKDLTLLRDSNNYDADYRLNAQKAVAKMDQIAATYEGKNQGIVLRINAEKANLEAKITATQLLQDDKQAAKMEQLGFTRDTQMLILDDRQEGDLIAQRQAEIARMDQILANHEFQDDKQKAYLQTWRDIADQKNRSARTIQELKNAGVLNATQVKVDSRLEELGLKQEYDTIRDVRLFDQSLVKQSNDIEGKLRVEAAKAENKGTYLEKLYTLRADELKLQRETSQILLGDKNKYQLEQLGVKQDYALTLQNNQLTADQQEYLVKETNKLKIEADRIRSSDAQKAAQLDNIVRVAELKIKAGADLQQLKNANALVAQESRQANQQLLASVYGVKFKQNPDEFQGSDGKLYFQQTRDGVGYMVDAYGAPAPEGLSFRKADPATSMSEIEKKYRFYKSIYPTKSDDEILTLARNDKTSGSSSNATTKQKDYNFLISQGKTPEQAYNAIYGKGSGQTINVNVEGQNNATKRQEIDISGYVETVNTARRLKAKITNTISSIPADTSAGIFATATGKLKDIAGWRDQESTFRTLSTELINTGALQNLPPGSASEADVALVKRGVPPENADVSTLRDWMAAIERIANYDIRYNNALIQHLETEGRYSTFKAPEYDPTGIDQAASTTLGTYTTPSNVSKSADVFYDATLDDDIWVSP